MTYAAPVEINGKRGNMAVVIKQTGKNRYKAHRILSPSGGLIVFEDGDIKKQSVYKVTGSDGLNGESTPTSYTTTVDNNISKTDENSNKSFHWPIWPCPVKRIARAMSLLRLRRNISRTVRCGMKMGCLDWWMGSILITAISQ